METRGAGRVIYPDFMRYWRRAGIYWRRDYTSITHWALLNESSHWWSWCGSNIRSCRGWNRRDSRTFPSSQWLFPQVHWSKGRTRALEIEPSDSFQFGQVYVFCRGWRMCRFPTWHGRVIQRSRRTARKNQLSLCNWHTLVSRFWVRLYVWGLPGMGEDCADYHFHRAMSTATL